MTAKETAERRMRMFRIALCEDEKVYAETQERLCREILGRMDASFEIAAFCGAEDFLAAFSKGGERYHLILLDIIMDGMNGMELAERIREADKEADVIFLTSSPDFMSRGYDVHALHYLLKPVDEGQLGRLIKQVYEDKYQSQFYMLRSGTHTQAIILNNIIALEVVNRKIEITLTDGKVCVAGKLSALLEELPQGYFIRCHSGYAVNMRHIQEFDRSEIITKVGKRIPISRSYWEDVKSAYLTYMQDR
jgi:DNA-binding LytR/AlgR family response regulator